MGSSADRGDARRCDSEHPAGVQWRLDFADRYSDLGVPEGRYSAPANSATCLQVKAGDCAPRTLILRAPFFSRFDVGVTKRFRVRGRVNFELRGDLLNVFDNINFTVTDASRTPGTGVAGPERLSGILRKQGTTERACDKKNATSEAGALRWPPSGAAAWAARPSFGRLPP